MNKFFDKLFKGIDYFTGILTGLMVIFVFLNVVLRIFFNSGLTWSEELSRYLFVFVTYIGAISAMRVNGHMIVDMLISKVNPKLQMVLYVVSQGLIAILMAILLFASIMGSAVASTAALGAILIPMMVRAGYNRDKSTALVAAGNILSPIMPPSVPMIIFGVQASVSVTKMFMGGIAPAVYLSVALCVVWFFVAKKGDLPTAPRQSAKEVGKALVDGIWALLLPVLILVGLRSGKFTATEAGVICVAYGLIVGILIYKELKVSMLMDCLVSAAKSSSTIMFLAAAAMVSSWMMTVANIPATVIKLLAPFLGHQTLLMLVICLLTLLVGTSMDVTPTIMILTPVLLPAIKTAGIDPAYFGVVFILVTVMGLLTPPVGTVLNVACSAGRINMERIVKAIWPFLAAEIVILLLMVLFPQLVTIPMNFFTGA